MKDKRKDALPHLQTAALKAAQNNGPFDSIIIQMNAAVEPGLGETMSEENKVALEDAFLRTLRKRYRQRQELIMHSLLHLVLIVLLNCSN